MNKTVVSVVVIFCALFLSWTFGTPIQDGNNIDLSGQDEDQEANRLSLFQEAIRETMPESDEEQIVNKESLSKDEAERNEIKAVNDVDGNSGPSDGEDINPTKRPKSCWGLCWGCINC